MWGPVTPFVHGLWTYVKYRLDLEVDEGSGGGKGVDVSKKLPGPRCRWMRSQPGINRSLATAVKVKV